MNTLSEIKSRVTYLSERIEEPMFTTPAMTMELVGYCEELLILLKDETKLLRSCDAVMRTWADRAQEAELKVGQAERLTLEWRSQSIAIFTDIDKLADQSDIRGYCADDLYQALEMKK